MVGCLTFLILLANLAAIIALDVAYWFVGWQCGLAGVFGVIGFLIGYAISVEMAIAPREFWWNSEFGVFLKKIGYAWSAAGIVTFFAYLIITFLWGDPLEILPW